MQGNSSPPDRQTDDDAEGGSGRQNTTKTDVHHCICFSVPDVTERDRLRNGLDEIGAYDQVIQEDHGQEWARTYQIDDYWQLHVKMLLTCVIECEMEARIKYVEHHTIGSKPAHMEMQQLLEKFEIKYAFVTPTREPCRVRTLNTPDKPTDIALVALVFVLAAAAIMAIVWIGTWAIKKVRSRKE